MDSEKEFLRIKAELAAGEMIESLRPVARKVASSIQAENHELGERLRVAIFLALEPKNRTIH